MWCRCSSSSPAPKSSLLSGGLVVDFEISALSSQRSGDSAKKRVARIPHVVVAWSASREAALAHPCNGHVNMHDVKNARWMCARDTECPRMSPLS